jgi:hypothetical protein
LGIEFNNDLSILRVTEMRGKSVQSSKYWTIIFASTRVLSSPVSFCDNFWGGTFWQLAIWDATCGNTEKIAGAESPYAVVREVEKHFELM